MYFYGFIDILPEQKIKKNKLLPRFLILDDSTYAMKTIYHLYAKPEDENALGKPITAEELRVLAVQAAMAEYQKDGLAVSTPETARPGQVDFSVFTAIGHVNILVFPASDPAKSVDLADYKWLRQHCEKNDEIPRLLVVKCHPDTEEDVQDAPFGRFGDTISLEYQAISLLPEPEIAPAPEKLSEMELLARFADAWKQRDLTGMASYLAPDFTFSRYGEFDEITSRREFAIWFRNFLDIAFPDGPVTATLVRNRRFSCNGIRVRIGKQAFVFDVESHDGHLTAATNMADGKHYRALHPKKEITMCHGDHFDFFFPEGKPVRDYLAECVRKGNRWKQLQTALTGPDRYNQKTQIFSIRLAEAEIGILLLVQQLEDSQSGSVISAYPIAKGAPLPVIIERVVEWDNQVEATVYCRLDPGPDPYDPNLPFEGQDSFTFFATDYYCNKTLYKPGTRLSIDFAALGAHMTEGRRNITLEGQDAINFRNKIGAEQEFNQDGSVKPMVFSLEQFVAIDADVDQDPDEAVFQSPVTRIRTIPFLGNDYTACRMILTRKTAEKKSTDIHIPLYFLKTYLPELSSGTPVSGVIWMVGSITGLHKQDAGLRKKAAD